MNEVSVSDGNVMTRSSQTEMMISRQAQEVQAAMVIAKKFPRDAVALREIVITFYVCNEAISLLENAAEFIPIPEKLKEVLIQLRDKEEQ